MHVNDELSSTRHFNKGTYNRAGAMMRSGLFSQCRIMRNTYFTSYKRHDSDVTTGKKVESSFKKKKVHVPITEPKVIILDQAAQKRLIFFKKILGVFSFNSASG